MIGYLEPHDRPETAALADGLEEVPHLRSAHGGLELTEMDVDAVIRRAPELALVDELAHTNGPRRRNRKRYEDIDEILAAGIDVISTVNVQHLESLNDSVFELTGVRVRETFPDRILDEADEVVLVDLTPEALRERLEAGKVYAPTGPRSRCRTSSGSTTWRRCASSCCASSPRTSRRGATGRARPAQPAGGRRADPRARHAGAALAADPAPRVALGPAARLRDRRALGAQPGASSSEEEAVSLAALRRLASILGAHFIEVEGDDLVATVKRFVGERGSTYVFVGTPDESRRTEILRGSLVSALVRELPGVDIRVVADRALREEEPR